MRKLFCFIVLSLIILTIASCALISPMKDTAEQAHEHSWIEANCYSPATCECGATDGEARGHVMREATCLKPTICAYCGLTEGDVTSHIITSAYGVGAYMLKCEMCAEELVAECGIYADGTDHSAMLGVSNSNNFTTAEGTDDPIITDGYYSLINTTGEMAQNQLWLPKTSDDISGFASKNRAVGFISFRMNYYTDGQFNIKLADTGADAVKWTPDMCLVDSILVLDSLAYIDGVLCARIYGWDETLIATVAVDDNYFSGWFDIKIGIVLDPDKDEITLHYYYNGIYVTSRTKELTPVTNAINSVYISGKTSDKGSGIMFDDFIFAYTDGGKWLFDECDHEMSEAGCITDGTCNTCGATGAIALGHSGGKADCDSLAICKRCGVEYGDYGHDLKPATCTSPAMCKKCGKTVGDPISHVLTHTINGNSIIYQCLECLKSYSFASGYVLDGSSHEGMAGILNNGIYTTYGNTHLPEINADGQYQFLNIVGEKKQFQLWIPYNTHKFDGFDSDTNSLGMFSCKLNVAVDYNLGLTFINNGSNADRWSDQWCIREAFISMRAPETVQDRTTVTLLGWDGIVLKTVDINEPGDFTGWIDVKVAINLDAATDTIILDYYIDGIFVGSASRNLTTVGNAIDSVYISGNSAGLGTGIMLDDIAFGYFPGE